MLKPAGNVVWLSAHKLYSLCKLPSSPWIRMSRVIWGEAGWCQHRSASLGIVNMALPVAAGAQNPGFGLPSLFCPLSRHHTVIGEEVGAFLSPGMGRGHSENRDVISGAPGSREAGLCLRGSDAQPGELGRGPGTVLFKSLQSLCLTLQATLAHQAEVCAGTAG